LPQALKARLADSNKPVLKSLFMGSPDKFGCGATLACFFMGRYGL
jgi:hypothetical protein